MHFPSAISDTDKNNHNFLKTIASSLHSESKFQLRNYLINNINLGLKS